MYCLYIDLDFICSIRGSIILMLGVIIVILVTINIVINIYNLLVQRKVRSDITALLMRCVDLIEMYSLFTVLQGKWPCSYSSW